MSPKQPRELQDLGYGVHLVPLTRNRFALIDSADAELVGRWCWSDSEGRYAYRRETVAPKTVVGVYMHRFILAAPAGLEVDHINGDGFDNRRSNLRLCTPSQNQHNKRRYRNNTSGFKGVTFCVQTRRWKAYITHEGRVINIGRFDSPEEAHAAYCELAVRLHGEFARVE